MKFLKKASLAAAIAAASISAQAGMVALDDETMAATTGQAGVTIEINIDSATGISVGEIEYIDEGSVLMQNLTVKNVNNLTQEIDVDSNGNLLLTTTPITGMQIALGDDGTGAFSAVALKSVSGATTELVNNLDMTLNLGKSKTAVLNLAAETNTVDFSELGGFGGNNIYNRTSLPESAKTGSVAILSKSSIQITEMNVGMFGYTREQADARADLAAYGGNGDGVVNAGLEQVTSDSLATGSAVEIEGLEFYAMVDHDNDANTAKVKGAATIEQTIWAKGGAAADGGGVYIQIGQIAGNLEVGAIKMGGASIGSVAVRDINLSGMTQRIYGH